MAIPSEQELATMPLDQLEQLVMQQANEVSSLLGGEGTDAAPAAPGEMMPAPEGSPAVDPYMDSGAPLDMLSSDIIQMATTRMVESGFLDVASSEMTPELIQVLQGAADAIAPGIYNMNNDADLTEFVNGIANGTIPLSSTRSLTADAASGAGPEPIGPEPAGGLPAGGPPAGGGGPVY
tara:strand:+ start:8349 stop:8885 length:537 start_codon:yes stop_codon:yes gene_type:complete